METIRNFDLNFYKKVTIDVIKKDKKVYRSGVKRYELLMDTSTGGIVSCYINRIDDNFFKKHEFAYHIQGFKEHKRINTMLGDIQCTLVVMRNEDENKNYEQYDGLLVDYLKAGCEICYIEVDLRYVK